MLFALHARPQTCFQLLRVLVTMHEVPVLLAAMLVTAVLLAAMLAAAVLLAAMHGAAAQLAVLLTALPLTLAADARMHYQGSLGLHYCPQQHCLLHLAAVALVAQPFFSWLPPFFGFSPWCLS